MAPVAQTQPKAVVEEVRKALDLPKAGAPETHSQRGYVLLALLAGTVLGAVGGRVLWPTRPADETRFLNFDPESTPRAALATGWGVYEHNEQGETWVWCAAQSCTLFVDAHGSRDRLLRLRLWGARFPDITSPQTASLKVNGIEAGVTQLGGSPIVWQVPTAKNTWQEGRNSLRFDFTYAEAPAKHIPGNTDPRSLAASFDWLEVIPQ
jgi:hypothetical protein